MDEKTKSPITRLLSAVNAGDQKASEDLISLVYSELRQMARGHMRAERNGHSLRPTALVNETYLKLRDLSRVQWTSRAHFFGTVSQLMRQILVDHARRQRAAKRGGAARITRSANDRLAAPAADLERILFVDQAVQRLAAVDPRQARVVEMKYFAQMENEEVAEALSLSLATVKREWAAARAWLQKEFDVQTRSRT